MEENIESKPGMLKMGRAVWIAVIALLIIGALVLWKFSTEKSLNEKFSAEKQELVEQANSHFKLERSQILTKVHKTFVWAVRSEMLRGNMETVDQYLIQFVREKGIEQVALADPAGGILLSSDKKMEGKQFSDFYPSIILQSNASMVVDKDSVSVYVFGPVMGLDKKLGTLVFVSESKVFVKD